MIAILSMWRNDAVRDLETRVAHLLEKTCETHPLRWLWITGDNNDETCQRLGAAVTEWMHGRGGRCPVTIIDADTGIVGEDPVTRRRRGSAAATELFRHIPAAATYVVFHESDLRSPANIVDRFLESGQGNPIAGWPTITLGGYKQFYDIWAYRDLHGRQFNPRPPYCKGFTTARPFRVGSFGSAWLVPGDLLRGRRIESRAILELCETWCSEGVELLVDARIPIEQPQELWTP